MATVEVEVYATGTGRALDPQRPASLEDEIREHELIAQRDAAARVGLTQVVATCEWRLAQLRCARTIAFPLLTPREVSVWRRFLPMTYSSRITSKNQSSQFFQPMESYAFDVPPLSVLELYASVQATQVFNHYEIWTPERPLPEPILVGYKKWLGQPLGQPWPIGPFLLARWGEALEDFETIAQTVAQQRTDAGRAAQVFAAAAQQQFGTS